MGRKKIPDSEKKCVASCKKHTFGLKPRLTECNIKHHVKINYCAVKYK